MSSCRSFVILGLGGTGTQALKHLMALARDHYISKSRESGIVLLKYRAIDLDTTSKPLVVNEEMPCLWFRELFEHGWNPERSWGSTFIGASGVLLSPLVL